VPSLGIDVEFPLDEFTQYRLVHGLDDIGLTLQHADDITKYEQTRAAWLPHT
jgi:3-isopropylmalate/(R)-2-methylmalate dehydratase small subunit